MRRVSPPAPDRYHLQVEAESPECRATLTLPAHQDLGETETEPGRQPPGTALEKQEGCGQRCARTARSWPSPDRRQGPCPYQPNKGPACHLDTPCLREVLAPLTQAPAAPQNLHLEDPLPTSHCLLHERLPGGPCGNTHSICPPSFFLLQGSMTRVCRTLPERGTLPPHPRKPAHKGGATALLSSLAPKLAWDVAGVGKTLEINQCMDANQGKRGNSHCPRRGTLKAPGKVTVWLGLEG